MGKQIESIKVSFRKMFRSCDIKPAEKVTEIHVRLFHSGRCCTSCWNMCRTESKTTISDFSELECKILMRCLECLLEIKLPHNKIGSILVLLDTLDCEIDEIRETSNKLKAKYAAVLKLIEDGEFSKNEQKDFVLLRISTVTVSSVTTTTTITEKTA